MSELAIYSSIMVLGSLVSAVSQIMLKKSTQHKYTNKIKEYLNPLVFFAYVLFFGATFISLLGLKVVPLSMAPILEASGYIFVAILSFIFLKEKLSFRQIIGIVIIIIGVIIYSIGG